MYTILLFYRYVQIVDPQALADFERAICERLSLKGRIIIAHEGINATVEGTDEAIQKYCRELTADSRFADVHFKKSVGTGKAFPKLSVKVRKEIVTLGLPAQQDVDPAKTTGKYLSAEELQSWFDSGKKFKIVDMRNDYEHRVGHFKDSVLPPIHNFRDLPKALPALEPLKNETVLTVCTGGVRCEKASGYLVKNGFKDVYQLQGGIVTYMEKFERGSADQLVSRSEDQFSVTTEEQLSANNKSSKTSFSKEPAKNFLGSLYVFDNRVTMAYASAKERSVVGTCDFCRVPAETYVNCTDDLCHKHFIVCEGCNREGILCGDCVHKG